MAHLHFGGSFNPIHVGHLICARAVAEEAGFEKVILVPCSQPPHKAVGEKLAGAEDRLEMCRLAAAQQGDMFEVDELEIKRPPPSYTIDTVRELKKRGTKEVHWLIGADMLMYLPKWHEPEALLKEVKFVVMQRPGTTIDWSVLPEEYQKLKAAVVKAPLIEISSTDIRKRLKTGKSIEFMVASDVREYLRRRRLYRDEPAS
jgi:nicotinate-nucleotide adenylyltransferase